MQKFFDNPVAKKGQLRIILFVCVSAVHVMYAQIYMDECVDVAID